MQLANAPKTHFWRICPEEGEGKPGAAEAAGGGAAGQYLEQNKPENKKCAYRFDSANCNLAVSFLRSEATLALPLGELAAPLGQTERVPRSNTRFQSSNGVPSQSACSADSSPIGRAKGAAAPVR